MNNIGDHIHEQVVHAEVIPILVKIVKKKVIFSPETIVLLSVANVVFSLLSLWSFSFLAVRFACQRANISLTRCNTNISWWCFGKVSAVL